MENAEFRTENELLDRGFFILHSSFYILHSNGAPGRTRTEPLQAATIRVYETRPVAAEAQGLSNLDLGLLRNSIDRNAIIGDRFCRAGLPGFFR